MTKKTFMQAFRQVAPKYYWHLDGDSLRGYLRGSNNNIEYCPITALARVKVGKVFELGEFDKAADELELIDDPTDITEAADNEDTDYPQLRRSLLKAVAPTLKRTK